jgi:hypothetical protein
MSVFGAIVLVFLVAAILQPSPQKRKRRHTFHHRRAVAAQPATAALQISLPIALPVPRRKQAPRATKEALPVEDPTRGDVFSALKNMGFSAKNAKMALQKATATGFEGLLKQSLSVLQKPEPKVLAGC